MRFGNGLIYVSGAVKQIKLQVLVQDLRKIAFCFVALSIFH